MCNDVYAICFLGYSAGLYIGMRHAPMLGDRQYQISPHINIGALFCSVRFIASRLSSLHYICVLACSPLVNVDLGKESTIEPIQRNCVRKRRVCVCVLESSKIYWLSSGFLACAHALWCRLFIYIHVTVSSGHGRQEQLTNQKEKKKLIKKPVFLCTTGRDQ